MGRLGDFNDDKLFGYEPTKGPALELPIISIDKPSIGSSTSGISSMGKSVDACPSATATSVSPHMLLNVANMVIGIIPEVLRTVQVVADAYKTIRVEEEITERVRITANANMEKERQETERIRVSTQAEVKKAKIASKKEIETKKLELKELKLKLEHEREQARVSREIIIKVYNTTSSLINDTQDKVNQIWEENKKSGYSNQKIKDELHEQQRIINNLLDKLTPIYQVLMER